MGHHKDLGFHSEVGKHGGILNRGVIWSNLEVNGVVLAMLRERV